MGETEDTAQTPEDDNEQQPATSAAPTEPAAPEEPATPEEPTAGPDDAGGAAEPASKYEV
jgi:hypothetical protein